MTVNPGFGHQRFLPTTLPKIQRARQVIEQMKLECDVGWTVVYMQRPLAVTMGANVRETEGVAAARERLRAAIPQPQRVG
jgi:pentose-5-phosphate-3-epimerase